MRLSIQERILLLNLLPARGSLVTLRLVGDFQKDLGFTEQELEESGIRQETDKILWSKETDKEISVGTKMQALVYDLLEKLDKNESLAPEHLSLCEKFGYGGAG